MSSQKSLVIKIFAVGHRKIVDFPALAKNDKLLSFLQKSDAYFSPLKVFAIRSTFWGPRDCRNSTLKPNPKKSNDFSGALGQEVH